ncbi:MAG: mechanosensitive ion channel family protein [Rhodobacteraceae bacterium]|nr:mechanosensitive ion channel family protein [Paracoccaceae bacterium]
MTVSSICKNPPWGAWLVRVFTLLISSLLSFQIASAQSAPDWSGEWQSYWRTGQALLSLEQSGNQVTGSYEPGRGALEGSIEDGVLRGTWTEPGDGGVFVFVLSQDGATFTGRFDTGAYWNGFRATDVAEIEAIFDRADSPRETMRTIVTAANDAIYSNRVGAVRFIEPLMLFEGEETDSTDRSRRRTALWTLIDMMTFLISEFPDGADEDGGDTAVFEISTARGLESYELRFVLGGDGVWRLSVPELEPLRADIRRILNGRGYADLGELETARAHSPRATMLAFEQGVSSWNRGGDGAALETLDLRHVADSLRPREGAVLADYLSRIIDRVGLPVWQEIPDYALQPVPYIYYRHPVGNIVIASEPGAEGEPPTWRFTRESLRNLPDLYDAIERMPLAEGQLAPPPLSSFFETREAVLSFAPALSHRILGFEAWKLLGMVLAVSVAMAAGFGTTMALRRIKQIATLARPMGLVVAAYLIADSSDRVGLSQALGGAAGGMTAMLLTVAIAAFLYALTGLVGRSLMSHAASTSAYSDEIVTSLATGLVKLLIVVGAIIICADFAGLPYEGVLTGLGVGGVALAFAARDTVSNMLGGAILLADRPFKKGDLVEVAGNMATIEVVGLRSTRLRSLDDTLLVVPNSQMSDTIIANWGARRKRRMKMEIGLVYDTPREKLELFSKRVWDLARDHDLADPASVYVGVKGLGASSIDIELIVAFLVFSYEAQVKAQQTLILDIISLAEEIGVEFAFPTRTIHVVGSAPEGAGNGQPSPIGSG